MSAKDGMKRKRGRPRKDETPPKKKRGRPSKKDIEEREKLAAQEVQRQGTIKLKDIKFKKTEEILEEKPLKDKRGDRSVSPHYFAKGQSGNPEGARAHHQERKLFRAATDKEFAELMQLLINGDMDAIKEISEEANREHTGEKRFSVMQIMTARVALKIIATGNAEAWEKFLTRTYGKPKENIGLDLTGLSGIKGRVTVNMPANGREAK